MTSYQPEIAGFWQASVFRLMERWVAVKSLAHQRFVNAETTMAARFPGLTLLPALRALARATRESDRAQTDVLPARPSRSLTPRFIWIGSFAAVALLCFALLAPIHRSMPAQPLVTKPLLAKPLVAAAPAQVAVAPTTMDSPPPRNTPEFVAASKMMIAAPPRTAAALQEVDPVRLRKTFERGAAILAQEGNYDDETTGRGAQMVSVAAILGYQPARTVIVQGYPRSGVIRSTVSSVEAVRYSLDPLLTPGSQSESKRVFLALLASYFAGHHELPAYGDNVLAVLRDDQRLQTDDRVQALLNQLSRVHGACAALGYAMVKGSTAVVADCSQALQMQIQGFVRAAEPAGSESESRRQALHLLENLSSSTHAM